MTTICRILVAVVLLSAAVLPCRAGELTVSRDALERTLKQQLFSGPNGRYYLKGNPQSPCAVSAEDPRLSFAQDRIVVEMKTHARMGRAVGGACVGMAFSFPAEVSFEPEAEGETIGFRDARLDRVSSNGEVNFLLSPFLRRQVPSSMKVNAADLLRKALAGSTSSSGYKVSLDRLKVHSIIIQGDALVVDVDGDLSIR
ncbi:MAG TPA: hypothetical protein VL991_12895 [Terracidiphilus sp.]|jgi:hypothetical protein|nr:hypothetical protein [Terracidiphilus sp.]